MEISKFYENVGLKFKNSYGREEIKKLILDNLNKPGKINQSTIKKDKPQGQSSARN